MGLERWLRDQLSRPTGLPNFDSSTTMVRALASHLHGEGFPALGIAPPRIARAAGVANHLPPSIRTSLFRFGSAQEAVDPGDLRDVDADAIRSWVTGRYPERGYPAVVVGSANGAGVHLAALLGVPWLPQSFLIPVRRDVDPDEPRADFAWAREPGAALLANNDDIAIHQMNDPNQDRAPLPRMAYFRIKLLELGEPYRRFLRTVLAPGGRVILSDCRLTWPSTTVADRHYFQFGCIGGLGPTDYYEGSEQVRRFLARQGSTRQQWDPPAPDGERCEAEWGFAPALGQDTVAFARGHGYQVRRLVHEHPRDLSPLVAALYRRTYERHGFDANRLIASSFAQLDPWWTLRTGSVPFWLSFTSEADADALADHLDGRSEPYDEIYVTLFNHGVDSAGLAPADRWAALMDRATDRGRFLGVNPDEFPRDFASYAGYNTELPATIPARRPLVPPPSLEHIEQTIEEWSDPSVSLVDA